MKIINWFQIPATDIDRAIKFYGDRLGVSFHRMDHNGEKHVFFAMDTLETERTSGKIIQSANNKPAQDGVLIYLNALGGVDTVLGRVERADGKISYPKCPSMRMVYCRHPRHRGK